MALAYAVNQGAQVAQQAMANKPSPYPQQQGYGAPPPQGQAAGYYQQVGAAASGYHPGYGAPPPQQAFGGAQHSGSPTTNPQLILNVLKQGVQDQNLHAFYPPGSLEQLAQRIAQTGALARIASEWRLPNEVAFDLARLALFDVQLYIDDSGSMAFEENGSRIDDAKLVTSRVAQAASLFDTDGIQVFFMNSPTVGHGISNEGQAQSLLSGITFSGLTPLGTSLENKILRPLVHAAQSGTLRKPVLVIAVTDGEPASENRYKIVDAIKNAKNALGATRYGPDTLSIELAQVGNDQKAAAFLNEIDRHPDIGRFVDVTSNFETESAQMQQTTGIALVPDMWLVKLLMGGISSEYDSHDEVRH
ncbi:hypothetical protein Rhopal_007034-T1 [Rhodotorula paludigena]|uniref:VWFA domain-containing protein n=1 Tax=Rhodotorula paludigena TaxID=86838 RepID=A0AAV5GWU9_9BASI|nr:hypothetical protein Rhopal_007034-T1 [Rhodotorula paludigena]